MRPRSHVVHERFVVVRGDLDQDPAVAAAHDATTDRLLEPVRLLADVALSEENDLPLYPLRVPADVTAVGEQLVEPALADRELRPAHAIATERVIVTPVYPPLGPIGDTSAITPRR